MNIDDYREEQTIGDLFGHDVPEWISPDVDIDQLVAIAQGGCESGAYMPAVTYHEARETMNRHGDEVLDYIDAARGLYDNTQPSPNESWSGIAVHYLSMAVELYASEALARIGIEV